MKITTVGIDLAKNVFQVHAVDERGRSVLRKQLRRDQMRAFFVNVGADRDAGGASAINWPARCNSSAHRAPDGTAVRQTLREVEQERRRRRRGDLRSGGSPEHALRANQERRAAIAAVAAPGATELREGSYGARQPDSWLVGRARARSSPRASSTWPSGCPPCSRLCAVKKAALSSGCKPRPATAPAGSNRSSHGGNEMAEAFGYRKRRSTSWGTRSDGCIRRRTGKARLGMVAVEEEHPPHGREGPRPDRPEDGDWQETTVKVARVESRVARVGELLPSGDHPARRIEALADNYTRTRGCAGGCSNKYKVRRRRGGSYPTSHLYGHFGLVRPDPTLEARRVVGESVILVREPDAGNPPVRFDEREVETEHGEASEAPADERAGNR